MDAHAACNGDHLCLVDVWMNEETITGLLEDLVSGVGVRPSCLNIAHTTCMLCSRFHNSYPAIQPSETKQNTALVSAPPLRSLNQKVPPELEGSIDDMVAQHLDLYDWGTSNPIYSNLESSFIQPGSVRGSIISGSISAFRDPRVAGAFDAGATDARVLTLIECGQGSYLERVSKLLYQGMDSGFLQSVV